MANNCPIVAIESTGVYWRPVHDVLEGYVNVVLINARHVKNVPGRKTDIEDSKWLAGLLRNGLLAGSFIPDKETRHWRKLVTLRKSHTNTANDYKRRVYKLFECANIKISSVVSDLFGVTGRNLMDMLCDENATAATDFFLIKQNYCVNFLGTSLIPKSFISYMYSPSTFKNPFACMVENGLFCIFVTIASISIFLFSGTIWPL